MNQPTYGTAEYVAHHVNRLMDSELDEALKCAEMSLKDHELQMAKYAETGEPLHLSLAATALSRAAQYTGQAVGIRYARNMVGTYTQTHIKQEAVA